MMVRTAFSLLVSIALILVYGAGTALSVAASDQADPAGDPGIQHYLAREGQTAEQVLFRGSRAATRSDVDPGPAPEGDYMGWCAFTTDGNRVLATNGVTDNVTVFDWATMNVLATFDVGNYPGGIACNDDYAVIACAFDDLVYIVSLVDYSVAAVIPTGEQPWVVRIGPDGDTAYVACDIDDVCEVIDLATLTHTATITGFPISLVTYSYGSETGRNSVEFSGFEVTPDGAHLMACDRTDSLIFFNTATGAVDYTVAGVGNSMALALSGDGTKAVVGEYATPTVAHRVDLATHAIDASVTLTGYSLSTFTIGVNGDGSKAFLGISNNSSAFVRFTTSDFSTLSSTYTPFAIGTSPDHSLAIGMQYRFSVLDFATESLLGQYQGAYADVGAVSPVGSRVADFHPVLSESLNFFDYSTPTSPIFRGATPSGADPEGDAPRRTAITPDGTKILVTNVLSDNLTIIDLASHTVEAVLPIGDRVQDVAVTSDSRWAVVCGFENNSVKIIDLTTDTEVADVPCGTRASEISISPDDSHAYVGNISANTVSVVQLAGAASTEVAEVPCGVIGLVWAAYGVSSDVECSPSGDYVLVAASFDDQVKVLDTATNTIVASLPTGDFPIGIAFNTAGDYAVVSNYFDDTYTVVHVDGASSSVVGTFAGGDGPLRVAHNPVLDQVGIGNYYDKTITHVDPVSGAVMGTTGYSAYGNLIGVSFDGNGDPVALTTASGDDAGHLHGGGEVIPLVAVPAYFCHSAANGVAVVASPGPDIVTIVQWEGTVGAGMTCVPSSGTVPFTTMMTATLTNNTSFARQISGNIFVKLAGGAGVSNWKAGYTNVSAGGSYTINWGQAIPALGSVIGGNIFKLTTEDTTPAPYNQPPYPPSGDTATSACTVEANAP